MKQKWMCGATFPTEGNKNIGIETKAIQEADGTWTADVARTVNGAVVKHTLFGGFETLFQALRTANEIGLALAVEETTPTYQY